jgi:flagellar protein FliO/FliZ
MDWTDYLRFLMALIFVLALMGGLYMILRKFGLSSSITPMGVQRRLKIVEILPLDARRKAILLRRDNTDHLIILNQNNETVVEQNIPVLQNNPIQDKSA